MVKRQRFIVPVDIEVLAGNAAEAAAEVLSFLSYAFEVSNDEGRLKNYRLHEKFDTIPAGST